MAKKQSKRRVAVLAILGVVCILAVQAMMANSQRRAAVPPADPDWDRSIRTMQYENWVEQQRSERARDNFYREHGGY